MDLFALNLPIKQLEHGRDLPLPQYATKGAAGMDLYAAVEVNLVIAPGEWLWRCLQVMKHKFDRALALHLSMG